MNKSIFQPFLNSLHFIFISWLVTSFATQAADLELKADRAIRVEFDTIAGRYYQVQSTDKVGPPTWVPFSDPVKGNGSKQFVCASMDQTNQMLFRVVEYDLRNGLIAYFPFNGNALDESGNGNDGTINGAQPAVDRSGNANHALVFDGNDDVRIGNDFLLSGSSNATITGWINIPAGQRGGYIVSAGDGRNGADPFLVMWENAGYFFGTFDDNSIDPGLPESSLNSGEPIVAEKDYWIFFAQRMTSGSNSSTFDFFIDANLKYSTNVNRSHRIFYDQAMPVQIGRLHTYQGFVGKIDDVRFYNRALSNDEIRIVYNLPAAVPDLNVDLLANYTFSNNGNDSTTNGNNISISAGVFTSDEAGRTNSAVQYSGVWDSLLLSSNLNNSSLSVAFSFKKLWANAAEGSVAFRMGSQSLTGKQFHIGLDYPIGKIRFTFFFDDLDVPYSLAQGEWGHVVCTYDHATMLRKVYFNGELIGQGTAVRPYTGDSLTYVGGNIVLDNLRIYNRAISELEVRNLNAFR